MRHLLRTSISQRVLIVAVAAITALLPVFSGSVGASRVTASPVYLTTFQNYHSTFQRNFNPFMTAARLDFTQGAIYEPLMVYTTAGGGHVYPWLATGYKWTSHNKVLLVMLRSGVKWSDGKAFTPADVVFTFDYGKKYAVADETGLMQSGQVVKVRQVGSHQVSFTFKTVNTTVLPQLLSTNTMIIPKHIWAKVKHPDTFANGNPVGTGPFARVTRFSSQEYILGKNPYYWQKGKPSYAGIKVPALSGNDPALLASIKGQIDWAGVFFPNTQKSYVAHDPAHYHYFYANNTYPLGLYFNDEQYPFSLYSLRKAVSLAINRKQISKIAEFGYEPPADALGMTQLWPTWVAPSLKAKAKALATYNPSGAKQVLTKAGFTYKGSTLMDPKGNPVSIDLSCPAGWTDWVTSLQIIQQNLSDIGINATFNQTDATSWLDKRSKRLLDAFFWAPGTGINPYVFFNSFMSKDSYFPVGQNALATGLANLSGWYSSQATSLLTQFRETASIKKQHLIAAKLEKDQLNGLPFVPTVTAALWYTYS
ncbi:MAG: ABC transporter substrate-binding protein, partial [Chloroflexota bacterium]